MKFLNKKMMITLFLFLAIGIKSTAATAETLEESQAWNNENLKGLWDTDNTTNSINKAVNSAPTGPSACTDDDKLSFLVGDVTDHMEACLRLIKEESNVKNWIEKGYLEDKIWIERASAVNNCCQTEQDGGKEICKNKKKYQNLVSDCIAIGHVLKQHNRKWDSTHQEKVDKKSTQMQNGQMAAGTSVAGSNISCISQGIETVDYEPCKKFVDAYTAAEAATQMVHAGQSVMLQGKLMDVEADMIKDQNSATGALKAQAKGMKEQANIYAQRAALDASKLGILYNLYEAIPKSKDLQDNCSDYDKRNKGLNIPGVTLSTARCQEAVRTSGTGFALLLNQAALDAMKAQLMTAAVSTANNTILSKLTNDRAKEAKRAIADIEDFKPTDPFKIATEEEKTTLCEKDPSSKQCTDIGLDANYDAVSDNTIVFGSTGSGSSYTGGSASENEIANGSDGTSSSGGSVPTIGSVIAEVDKSGSVESSAAGTVSSKANGGSASGGGGAGGGAGSLGGQTPQKAAEGGVAQAIASKVAGYSGGEGFSVTGGLGIKGKKSGEKSEENPFGKLFGKDGAKASDVNFRDIASTKVGAKGDNIFDMISKRYGAVNSEKRLVEYELAR